MNAKPIFARLRWAKLVLEECVISNPRLGGVRNRVSTSGNARSKYALFETILTSPRWLGAPQDDGKGRTILHSLRSFRMTVKADAILRSLHSLRMTSGVKSITFTWDDSR